MNRLEHKQLQDRMSALEKLCEQLLERLAKLEQPKTLRLKERADELRPTA